MLVITVVDVTVTSSFRWLSRSENSEDMKDSP